MTKKAEPTLPPLDPNDPAPVEPGTIADPEAHAAAIESGDLVEAPKPDTPEAPPSKEALFARLRAGECVEVRPGWHRELVDGALVKHTVSPDGLYAAWAAAPFTEDPDRRRRASGECRGPNAFERARAEARTAVSWIQGT